MKHVRVDDAGKIIEVLPDPLPPLHPDIAVMFIPASDDVRVGEILDVESGTSYLPAQTPEQFGAAKTAALTAVDTYHAETVQMLAGNPTQVEKDTWAMKLATAKAILAGTPPSPEGDAFLVAAGMADAQARTDWANRVMTNAAAFSSIVGVAEVLRDQAKTSIKAATTQAELDAAITANKAAAESAVADFKAKLGV